MMDAFSFIASNKKNTALPLMIKITVFKLGKRRKKIKTPYLYYNLNYALHNKKM